MQFKNWSCVTSLHWAKGLFYFKIDGESLLGERLVTGFSGVWYSISNFAKTIWHTPQTRLSLSKFLCLTRSCRPFEDFPGVLGPLLPAGKLASPFNISPLHVPLVATLFWIKAFQTITKRETHNIKVKRHKIKIHVMDIYILVLTVYFFVNHNNDHHKHRKRPPPHVGQ